MNKAQLNKEYPNIANHFENAINTTPNRYKSVRHDYNNPKRGVSLEKVFKVLYAEGIEPRLDILPWYKTNK